jgi:hypothetical protein
LPFFGHRKKTITSSIFTLRWDEEAVVLSDIDMHEFSLSASVSSKRNEDIFKITVVYGPTDLSLKDAFFQELASLKPSVGIKCLALGDFNQIYRARDMNNNVINLHTA